MTATADSERVAVPEPSPRGFVEIASGPLLAFVDVAAVNDRPAPFADSAHWLSTSARLAVLQLLRC